MANNIVSYEMLEVAFEYATAVMQAVIKQQTSNCWIFFATSNNRGYCNYVRREITIPVWAIKKGKEYSNWYLSHELAHSFAGPKAKHGREFM